MADAHLRFCPDKRNANKGTQRGHKIIEQSIRQRGAGRSGLAAKDGTMIAGNQTLEEMQALGITIKPVHTTGNEWVVVVRDDIEPGSKQAMLMGLEDNRASEVGLDFDASVIAALSQEVDLVHLWTDDELKKLTSGKPVLDFLEDDAPLSLLPKIPAAEQDRVPLSIVLNTYEARQWQEYKESIGENDDKRALLKLLETIQ